MSEHDSYNQTLFLEQEPLVEAGRQSISKNTRAVKKPSPLIFFVIIGVFLMIVYLSLRSLRHQAPPSDHTLSPSPTIEATPTILTDEIENLYKELEADLKKADPTINILPFPPIHQRILIDE